MFARTALALTASAVLCVPLAGCHGKRAASPPPPPAIGLVTTTAGIGDRSFNDEALAALRTCRRQTGTAFEAVVPASAADVEPKLALLATKNTDTIVGIGYPMASDLAQVALRFENTHFAIVDAVVDEPNVNSVTFKEEDGAFLAGALAASASRTHRVGFLGGGRSPLLEKYEAGFRAGAREASPAVEVRTAYAGSFVDPAAARRAASALFAERADVVFVVAGRAGLAAIAAATSRPGTAIVGADSDQNALAPGTVLASAVKRVDVAVLRVCREMAAHKPVSGHVALGAAEGGVALVEAPAAFARVGAAKQRRLASIQRALAAGELVAPATADALRAFRPVAVR